MEEELLQIQSGYFSAGVVMIGDRVIRAAPIVHYMIGWKLKTIKDYCRKKRWSVKRIVEVDD
jgi:hypothetical protein